MIIGIDASRAVTAQRTGTEAYACYLIQALLPLALAAGHQLRLYFNQPPPPDLFPALPGVAFVVMPFPRLWTHLRLGWELRRCPPDVFFTPAHVIPLTYHGPSVATVHDLGYHYFPQAHPRRQLAYLRWSTRHNARRSQVIIADSEATKTDLIRFYGVPAQKIHVVYPGCEPGLAQVTDGDVLAAVQARYGITPPYLLYLGTLQPRKNLGRLIQAYAQLPDHSHQLVLAGKAGWLTQPILTQIAALPADIAARIVLPGYVPDADKTALISGAVALLYPSLYEGFGFPVLEGQACGVPVLCAQNSSMPEVAGGGALQVRAERVAEIEAGITRLLTDDVLRQQLIAAGRANVARFTWEQAATQALHLLQQAARSEQ
ncbi:MAG: glycosyltransferase family 1 protein [Candidatus Promineifilaceae bacterium]